MEAGCDDVGIGALFGLYDWRFEVLGLVRMPCIFRSATASVRTPSVFRGCGRRVESLIRESPGERCGFQAPDGDAAPGRSLHRPDLHGARKRLAAAGDHGFRRVARSMPAAGSRSADTRKAAKARWSSGNSSSWAISGPGRGHARTAERWLCAQFLHRLLPARAARASISWNSPCRGSSSAIAPRTL